MGILAKLREFFGQAAAETGVAEPHPSRTAENVTVVRTDLPEEPELQHRIEEKEPLNFPDAPEPPQRLQ